MAKRKAQRGSNRTRRRQHLCHLALSLVAFLLQESSSPLFVEAIAASSKNKNGVGITNSFLRPTTMLQYRRMEDAGWNYNNNDDDANNYFTDDAVKNAEDTFLDMFYTSPSTWSALEWGVFAGLMTLFGICFFCWCLACVIPRCCGHRAAAMAYASMT